MSRGVRSQIFARNVVMRHWCARIATSEFLLEGRIRMITRAKLVCTIAASSLAMFAAMPAQALTMQECSAKYKAAQTAGTLNGQKWNDFRKAECASDAAATPAAAPAAAPAAPKTAEAKPKKSEAAPAA